MWPPWLAEFIRIVKRERRSEANWRKYVTEYVDFSSVDDDEEDG